jgi:general L-amino acid transport system permease protein
MAQSSVFYVRDQFAPAQDPPARTGGPLAWLRKNLFATPGDALLTVAGIVFLLWAVPPLYNYIIGHAVWPGGTVEDCRVEEAGACWAYIHARFSFFIYGFYPVDQYWRPNLVFLFGTLLIVPLLIPSAPFKRINAVLFFLVYPIVSFFLLNGGVFGMPAVPTGQWGGLLVTLIISLVGIICSIPLGILLALGRQSNLPVIKTLCVMFIELWRAVPLITVLFMASVMLPLFMLAEVVRGGLQALPRGQYEAAAALGLSYWKRTYFIILPQAIRHVIPGIVNNFIALFKDTSLVSIVGIFDLLNTVQAASSDMDWASPNQAETGYIFAAFVFWIFCFAMSRYSLYMERRLDTGYKR